MKYTNNRGLFTFGYDVRVLLDVREEICRLYFGKEGETGSKGKKKRKRKTWLEFTSVSGLENWA